MSILHEVIAKGLEVHARRAASPHPKYGAWDRAALMATAELFPFSERRNYAIGAVLGALQAKKVGLERVRFVEFGVAGGAGLLALCRIAQVIEKHFKITVEVVGLDNGEGLFEPKGYRDHPEIWSAGQFSMGGEDSLGPKLPPFCSLIMGDIADTVGQLEGGAPIAFASIDVDYYSSTAPILAWFGGASVDLLLPATVLYFDDVLLNWSYSPGAGEALAIAEFNTGGRRRIDLKVPAAHLYALQVFDHPIRTGQTRPLEPLEIRTERYIPTLSSVLRGPAA